MAKEPVRLNKALSRAREVAAQLGPATDRLNTLIQAVETAIAELQLGVTAYVRMNPDDPNWAHLLTFGKFSNDWQLLIESGPDGGDREDWSATPLRNMSRELRLQAVDLIPELIEKLIEEAASQVKAVQAKATQVENILAELKGTEDNEFLF
jgi:hypothetical protein